MKITEYDIIVFVNPNNPTGTVLDSNVIFDIAKENPKKTFIVDESFIEFSGKESLIKLLAKCPFKNIIIIKSLSKNLGVPGLRLGYVYTDNSLFLQQLQSNIPIWNSNGFAEFFLEIILKHKKALNDSYFQTILDRDQFIEKINNLGVGSAKTSGGNFFVVQVNKPVIDLQQKLIERYSVFIKDISDKINNGNYYIRLAVRSPEENNNLVFILSKELAE